MSSNSFEFLSKQLDKALEKMERKMDDIAREQVNIGKILAEQEVNLREHMRRTDLAEQNIEDLRKSASADIEKVEKEIEPLARYINGMKFLGKTLGTIGIIVAIIGTVAKVFFT